MGESLLMLPLLQPLSLLTSAAAAAWRGSCSCRRRQTPRLVLDGLAGKCTKMYPRRICFRQNLTIRVGHHVAAAVAVVVVDDGEVCVVACQAEASWRSRPLVHWFSGLE